MAHFAVVVVMVRMVVVFPVDGVHRVVPFVMMVLGMVVMMVRMVVMVLRIMMGVFLMVVMMIVGMVVASRVAAGSCGQWGLLRGVRSARLRLLALSRAASGQQQD